MKNTETFRSEEEAEARAYETMDRGSYRFQRVVAVSVEGPQASNNYRSDWVVEIITEEI